MVERKPILDAISHLVLIIGVLIVAFPVYVTFVASSHTTTRIMQTPMPLVPGDQLVSNYTKALSGERSGPGTKVAVSRMMTPKLSALSSVLTISARRG